MSIDFNIISKPIDYAWAKTKPNLYQNVSKRIFHGEFKYDNALGQGFLTMLYPVHPWINPLHLQMQYCSRGIIIATLTVHHD